MKKLLLLFSGFLMFQNASKAQCGQRYHDLIFQDSVVSNLTYGVNVRFNGAADTLKLDIYFPKGDTETSRPLIIMAHGGNFLGGDKAGTDVKPLCQDLTRMGYVVSSINYRVGMQNFPVPGPDSTDAAEAVMRATHDAHASVRFFRKSFENGNPYGIDTSNIFFAGVSAGGFMALQMAYLDKLSEFPNFIDTTNQQGLSGGLYGNSGNPGYSSNVKAIINYCGALRDTAWMEAGDEPVLNFHGTNDGTVPYGSATISLLGIYPLLEVDGSFSVAAKANEIGLTNCFEIYEGQNHVPHQSNADYYDTTLNITRNFLAHFVCGETLNCSYGPTITTVEEIQNDLFVSVYPNPAANTITIETEQEAEVVVFSVDGKLITTTNTHNNRGQINAQSIPNGLYLLQVRSGDKLTTKKIMIQH